MINYHDRPELSSSQIAAFMQDPVFWWKVHREASLPKPVANDSMQFGTDVHSMIEDGGPDLSKFVAIPHHVLNKDGHKKGKAWTDFKSSHPDDVIFFKDTELHPAHGLIQIWSNLNANRRTARWISLPKKETVITWHDDESGFDCRAMIDVIDEQHDCVIDWKTTRDIRARKFQSACYSMHYDIRLAFYRRGLRANNMGDMHIVAVAIENTQSYRVQPFHLSSEWIDSADDRLSVVLENIKSFNIKDELDKDIIELDAPRWATYDQEYEVN